MTLTIGIFDTWINAYAALNALTDLGLDPTTNEIEEVSANTVANEITDVEQHPDAPGSVNSLGAPLPPPGFDPTLSEGPLGEAYLDKGQDGLIGALHEAGIDREAAKRAAQTVENGGALVVVHKANDHNGIREALIHAGASEILG